MKYFYFIYFLVGYVAAKEFINLEALTPHCECNDIIDQIESKIANNTKDLLNLQKKYAKVSTRAGILLRELNENTQNIVNIRSQLISVETKQNKVISIVAAYNRTITTINTEVDEILDGLNKTDIELNSKICKVEDQVKRLISVSICDCKDVRNKESTVKSTTSQ